MDLQVGTSQCKFAKPELAYGPAKGVQTDSQVGSRVARSRKFHAYHWLMRFYNNRLCVINLCRLALGGQTVKNCVYLHPNLSLTKVYTSPRKSTQVHASGWPNEMQVERKSKTCVYLWVCLARALKPFCFFFFYPLPPQVAPANLISVIPCIRGCMGAFVIVVIDH